MDMSMSIGLRGSPSSRKGVGGWDVDAVLQIKGTQGRFGGVTYSSLAALAAAMGGTESAGVLSIGPYDPGLAALYTSDFSAGVDGWTEVAANAANGSIANVSNMLRLSLTTTYSIVKAIAVAARKAALLTATMKARGGSISAPMLVGGSASNLAANGSVSVSFGTPAPQTKSIVIGSGTSVIHAGVTVGGSGDLDVDTFSMKEVYPYAGFTPGQLSFLIDFTAPAAASGNKVLAQWGCDDEDHRVRVVWDASTNLRLIVTFGNVEQVNIDLGTVAVGTRHTIRGTVADNAVSANIDGGVVTTDSAVTVPGVGKFWHQRSVTGETFDGTINDLRVYAAAKADPNQLVTPTLAFNDYGDSTADGVGATVDWYVNLTSAYTPARAWRKNAAGGESTTQMLARVAADSDFYRDWTTIFMDRPNTGETSATWVANMKAAVGYLRTNRWFVMPPAQDSPSGTPVTNIGEVQALLLSDPFFAGHTLAAVEQAAYLAAVNDDATRSDFTHFNDAGQVIQATYIKAFMDAAGW